MKKYKQAKEKWFNTNVISYKAILRRRSSLEKVLVEYDKQLGFYSFPISSVESVTATQYKLKQMNAYEVYFLLKKLAIRTRGKEPCVVIQEVKLSDSLI